MTTVHRHALFQAGRLVSPAAPPHRASATAWTNLRCVTFQVLVSHARRTQVSHQHRFSSHDRLSWFVLGSFSVSVTYTLNSEPKALTGDKSEGIKSRGAAEAFIRGFSPVKAEGEEFNVLILSYTRELSRPFKENKG